MTTTIQEQVLNRIMGNVASQVSESIKAAVVEAVEKALSSGMNNALVENEFYKRLNDEMRSGLQNIYKEISMAAAPSDMEMASQTKKDSAVPSANTGKLFSEASRQIEEVMNTTLEATESIMSTVEGLMDRQHEMSMLLVALQDSAPETVAKLEEHVIALDTDLTDILTTCSFQDLTGQRLKKVVKALSDIQESIFDMYVSSGLMLKAREEMPEKNIEEITQESRKKFAEIKGSELKGPASDSASQSDVDSLLADLGL